MKRKKALVLVTVAAALCIFTAATVYQKMPRPMPVATSTDGFLSIGKSTAPVEIILIEDFRCRNCLKFSRNIIPKIQGEYVKNGRARFTLVPVSFLKGSQAMANATLEVYQQHSDRFLPYLQEILNENRELNMEDLVKIARRVGGIDLAKLQNCIEKGCHNKELESNLNWARNFMGLNFRTPALYINGAPGSTFSFEAIRYQVNQILGVP